jgi:hypothetical protein
MENGEMGDLFDVGFDADPLIVEDHAENVEFRGTLLPEPVVAGFVDEHRQQFLFHDNKRKARLSLAVLMDLSGPPVLLEKAFEKQVGQKIKKTTTSSKVLNRKT